MEFSKPKIYFHIFEHYPQQEYKDRECGWREEEN
jgi:hypothetical protein